jgi:mono/diheme cytochrome c family protein
MKRRAWPLFLINVALAATLVGLFLLTRPPTISAQATAGKVLFEETAGNIGCAACHGMDARGDGTAPDIRKADEAQIMDGLEHTGDMRNMGLSNGDVEAVAAYLAFVRKKAGI